MRKQKEGLTLLHDFVKGSYWSVDYSTSSSPSLGKSPVEHAACFIIRPCTAPANSVSLFPQSQQLLSIPSSSSSTAK